MREELEKGIRRSRWVMLADHLPDIPEDGRRCNTCHALDGEHWSDPIEVQMVAMPDGTLHLKEIHPT